MIFIFSAIYKEASKIIEAFELKKNAKINSFQVFEAEGIVLTITGVAGYNMATAVGYISSRYNVNKSDIFINYGSCCGDKQDTFLINKITDGNTNRTYYPDMLYANEFDEREITTVPDIVKIKSEGMLYDMEASYAYNSAIHFFQTHNIIIIKKVSDFGIEVTDKSELEKNIIECDDRTIRFIKMLLKVLEEVSLSDASEEILVNQLVDDMHCSVVMENSLRQYITYAKLANVDYKEILESMYEKEILPCKDKKEGKCVLDEFKKRILQ